jgi:hypothetical protein
LRPHCLEDALVQVCQVGAGLFCPCAFIDQRRRELGDRFRRFIREGGSKLVERVVRCGQVRICDIRRAGGGIQDGATSEQESQRYHRGDRHALKAIRPTTAGIVGSHGAGSDRNLRRGAIATLALGYRTRHRGPQLRQSWTVHRNGFGEEDQLRREGIGFGGQQDDLRAWGYSSDLRGDRWIVIQGKLLVEDEEVRSQLLDLQ